MEFSDFIKVCNKQNSIKDGAHNENKVEIVAVKRYVEYWTRWHSVVEGESGNNKMLISCRTNTKNIISRRSFFFPNIKFEVCKMFKISSFNLAQKKATMSQFKQPCMSPNNRDLDACAQKNGHPVFYLPQNYINYLQIFWCLVHLAFSLSHSIL